MSDDYQARGQRLRNTIITIRRTGALGSPISNERSGIECNHWRAGRSGWHIVRTEFRRMVAYDLGSGEPVFSMDWRADK